MIKPKSMSDNDKKYGYSFAREKAKYSDKDYTPEYSNDNAVKVFGLSHDLAFVYFVLDKFYYNRFPSNAYTHSTKPAIASVDEFKTHHSELYDKLIKGELDSQILSIIQYEYLEAIETYFDEIENKADELEYFKSAIYQYVEVKKNEYQNEQQKGVNVSYNPILNPDSTFAVRLVEKIRTLLNQLLYKISSSVESHEERQKLKADLKRELSNQPQKRRSIKRNTPYLHLNREFKCNAKKLNGKLKKQGFISNTTKFATIDNVFKRENSLIAWVGNKSELQYFIHQLYIKGIIKKYGSWSNAQEIFLNNKADKFTTTLRKNKAKDNPDNETTSIIDSIITDCFTKG